MKRPAPPAWHDRLINIGFVAALVMAVIPDIVLYPKAIALGGGAAVFALLLTISDALLFTVVFLFLKADIKRRREVEAALQKANEQLHAANELRSEFVRVAAHDLRNPIHVISNLAQMIPNDLEKRELLLESAHHISRASEEMLNLINDLLETSAIESGCVKLEKNVLDLEPVVRGIVTRYQPLAAKKQLSLAFSGEHESFADVDPDRLRRAVENLVINAIKFSRPGKAIRVALRKIADQLRIEVIDEGPGLTGSDMQKLFGRFQRLSAQPTGGESSTGLGLSIVKGIVEMHGGRVWAESEGRDKGSRFVIELASVHFPAA